MTHLDTVDTPRHGPLGISILDENLAAFTLLGGLPQRRKSLRMPPNETTEDKKKKDLAAEADEAATKKPLKKRKAVVATEAPAEDAAPETAKPSKEENNIKITM